MKNKDSEKSHGMNSSRRDFVKQVGAAAAGLLVVPYLKPSGVFAYTRTEDASFLATVAICNSMRGFVIFNREAANHKSEILNHRFPEP